MSGQTGYWRTPRMWESRTAVIIGGGPSLAKMDWEKLHQSIIKAKARAIACNDAYLLGWPDMVFFGDWNWYQIHKALPAFRMFEGMKVTASFEALGEPGLFVMERRDLDWQTTPGRIGWFGNTGVSALNLAFLLGVKKIVLLGIDMAPSARGYSNWYEKLKDQSIHPATYKRYCQFAKKLPRDLGMEVVNGNPNSKLDLFPKMTWQEALS